MHLWKSYGTSCAAGYVSSALFWFLKIWHSFLCGVYANYGYFVKGRVVLVAGEGSSCERSWWGDTRQSHFEQTTRNWGVSECKVLLREVMCTYVVQFWSAFNNHSVPAFVFENSGQMMLTCLHSGNCWGSFTYMGSGFMVVGPSVLFIGLTTAATHRWIIEHMFSPSKVIFKEVLVAYLSGLLTAVVPYLFLLKNSCPCSEESNPFAPTSQEIDKLKWCFSPLYPVILQSHIIGLLMGCLLDCHFL